MRWCLLFAAAFLLAGCESEGRAQHELAVPWTLGGHSLRADLHTHTLFSDGAFSVDSLAMRALLNGSLQVIVR